eukprot:15364512-Ditylum_brightwellii.AAC.1
MSSNPKIVASGGRCGGCYADRQGHNHGCGQGGNKWKTAALSKKKVGSKSSSVKTIVSSASSMEGYFKDLAKNFTLLLLTAAHDAKNHIKNSHWFRADPSLIPMSTQFWFKLTAPKKLQDIPEFKTFSEEVDKALKKTQDFIHDSIIRVEDVDI